MTKSSTEKTTAFDYSDFDQVGQFIWTSFSLASHLHDIRQVWAKRMNITGPQWLILFAITSTDEGGGVSVGHLAEKLHVNSTFVTTQTKQLEARGMVIRNTSPTDRRVVLLSASEEARQKIKAQDAERNTIHKQIFGHLSQQEFQILMSATESIERKASKMKTVLLASDLLD